MQQSIQLSGHLCQLFLQLLQLVLAVTHKAPQFLCLLFGALGFANMWMAIFADVGVMVLAVLNAIRALRTPK